MKLYILKTDKLNRKAQHRGGKDLLKIALGEDAYQNAEILVSAHGKPNIKGNPKYFNISHSGEYVVLAIGGSELGVDIQEKKDCRMEALVKRFFTPGEREAYEIFMTFDGPANAPVDEPCEISKAKKNIFYHIWCRKEAYGKYLGVGLQDAVLKTEVLSDVEGCQFLEYAGVAGYQISICCGKEEKLEEVINISEGL